MSQAPKNINTTRRIDEVLHVAGIGPRPAKIMFVMPALTEDDARESLATYNDAITIPQAPRYLKGQAGCIFKNILEEIGLPPQEQYFTAICKWLLPKDRRAKPKASDIAWAWESFENELKEVKPDIVVCLGKPVFDQFVDLKIKLREIEGGWFRSEKYGCRIYPMDDVSRPLMKPEFMEKFRIDLKEVKKMRDICSGITVNQVPQFYETITNAQELNAFVCKLISENHTLLSVDVETHGIQQVDGQLRSLQICWAPGRAVYIRLMDENLKYVFDVPYAEVGKILGIWLNQPHVKYLGHQIAADFTWMHHVLGLDVYRKAAWDTLYALQCIDESQDAGLKRLALAYTDLGRYDIDLVVWKKMNGVGADEGYGRIPDAIIIPYGCKDVDAVFRAYPQQVQQMVLQGPRLLPYFLTLFLPFVTDIFTNFTLVGLPIDAHRLDLLRKVFTAARDKLNVVIKQKIGAESKGLLAAKLATVSMDFGPVFATIVDAMAARDPDAATAAFQKFVPANRMAEILPVFEHFLIAEDFNIRSHPSMRRWLFEVKGFTPIKTTNNKEKGLPSMSWDKVQAMPEAARKDMLASTDKQTLKVLAEKDSLVSELLALNAIGNLTKAFMKAADIDDEGNLVRENGLHYWIASDGRVHGQFSSTETGRPRAWKPNSLNWPSWVTDQISGSILRLVALEPEDSQFRRDVHELVQGRKEKDGTYIKPPSIRSVVSALGVPTSDPEDGWCLVESDYQTAEVRGLAYISGDENLIRLLNEDDQQFAGLKVDKGGKTEVVHIRLHYAPDYEIAEDQQNPDFLMSIFEIGKDKSIKVVRKVQESELLRREDGTLWHPKHDLHWNLAEITLHKPREVLQKKKHRDGLGKTGNFKSAYGSSPDAMERSIEAETGQKPDAGTGQAILDTLMKRQPVADAYLKACELVPETTGRIECASGRIRHFVVHSSQSGINYRLRNQVASSAGREARNIECQESVAATSARAGLWLTEYYRSRGMQARIIAILYDSVVTLCKIKERHAVALLHQLFMCDINEWFYHGRQLIYPVDTEFNYRWSERPTHDQQKDLDSPNWRTDFGLTEKVRADVAAMRTSGKPHLIAA